MSDMPEEVKAWRSIPEVDHCGTWSETRYPDEAIVYIRSDLVIRQDDPDLRALVDALQRAAGRLRWCADLLPTYSAENKASKFAEEVDEALATWEKKHG